ncbi:MAG: GlsB/YeaQ/YmgE family stress response membrane protein [Clostridiales bacterium]|nr:GlsB/YeaQ/YmgE family stress response membrane protein [Clostridiales bacterium]
MGIISWIIMGGLAGWVASMITGRNQNMGLIANIVVGVIGGVLGGWIASLLGLGTIIGFNLGSFLIALGGSCLLLIVTGIYKKKK